MSGVCVCVSKMDKERDLVVCKTEADLNRVLNAIIDAARNNGIGVNLMHRLHLLRAARRYFICNMDCIILLALFQNLFFPPLSY